MKPFLLSQKWTPFALFFPLQPYINGRSIEWSMPSLHSYMVIYRRKFTWNNLLDMLRITLALSVTLRNPYMALSKLLELGMLKWIASLLNTCFSRCHSDPNVYTKKVRNHLIILVIYVDDLILTGSDPKFITHLKSNLKQNFEMSDLGHLHYFLGLQVLQTKEWIFLSQSKYACDLLHRFHMEDCKLAPSPFQLGVKLFATCTSPEVDATLYCQLLVVFYTWLILVLTFPLPLVVLPVICKLLMKVTGKKQK